MNKHTPGPWCRDGYHMSRVLHCTAERGSPEARHLCGDYETIADCAGDNWDANARLIAAAPALLECAEAVLIAWRLLAEALPQDDRIEAVEFEEFMALRSVVAKARGIESWDVSKHLAALEGGKA